MMAPVNTITTLGPLLEGQKKPLWCTPRRLKRHGLGRAGQLSSAHCFPPSCSCEQRVPKTKFSSFAQICRQLAFHAQNLLKHQHRRAKCLGRKIPFMQSLKGKKEALNLEQSTTRCFISFEEPHGSAAVVIAPPAAMSPGSASYTSHFKLTEPLGTMLPQGLV